jgi:iron complex transport system ATP-binding protein
MMLPVLQAENLSFGYGPHKVLGEASLVLHPGEFLALLGINGAGKSTLLRLMLGFEQPQSGYIKLAGRPLHGYKRRELARHIAYVPQAHAAPFPYLVRDVVMLGRIVHSGYFRAHSARDVEQVNAAMEKLGIAHLADRPYTKLSGGERQLTLIARALAQEARILILDEPNSGLDYGNQIRLLGNLRSLADQGYAVLCTTHHPEHVLLAADRVALLRSGRITATGVPKDVLTAETMRELYDVEVEWLARADGSRAFWPCLHTPSPEFVHV